MSEQRSGAKVALEVELKLRSNWAGGESTELNDWQSWVALRAGGDERSSQRVDLGEAERGVEWRRETNVGVDFADDSLENLSGKFGEMRLQTHLVTSFNGQYGASCSQVGRVGDLVGGAEVGRNTNALQDG